MKKDKPIFDADSFEDYMLTEKQFWKIEANNIYKSDNSGKSKENPIYSTSYQKAIGALAEADNICEYLSNYNFEGSNKPQWHDAKEENPSIDADKYYAINDEYPAYLVVLKYGGEPTISRFNGQKWFDDDVEYWMPLPKIPKKNKEETN